MNSSLSSMVRKIDNVYTTAWNKTMSLDLTFYVYSESNDLKTGISSKNNMD